jgi:3-hydroxyacyl-CoA dehydrogenase / enoyl-CoA hydratase / 3-hydroxybutyryl-CoA epimerase
MANQQTTPNLRLERRDDGVAVVWLDVRGEKVNVLRPELIEEISGMLEEIRTDGGIRAVVLASAKDDSFIVGADVRLLERVESAREAEEMARAGQQAIDRLESFPLPIVAAIHGHCVGGGLELAMGCSARVATDHDRTRLGLPEVLLGLLPGAGGTYRLPRFVGVERALDMILTGRLLPARRAASMGLVDEVVHPSILIQVASERALKLAAPPPVEARRAAGVLRTLRRIADPGRIRALVLEDTAPGRALVFSQARKKVLSRTYGNMPAPLKAIDALATGLAEGREAGLKAEAAGFGQLAVSPEARSLMALFLAREALKREPGAEAEPRDVRKVGILGAGLMGSGIAYVTAAQAEIAVRLKDIDHDRIRAGLKSIRKTLSARAAKKRMKEAEVERIMNLVRPATDYSGFGSTDLVIEAVVENLEVKHQVFRELQEEAGSEMILGSNTSSIPISKIAAGSAAPERVIGLHYFSPVDRVPLLEVIVTPETAPWVVATSVAFGKKQGKTVIVVNDGPGFYTTRILGPYLAEAAHLLAEGHAVEDIDRALRRFGFAVGPLELLDEVGIDVAQKIQGVLREAFGDRMAPVGAIDALVDDGRLGKKNGRGFYRYTKVGDGLYRRKKNEVDETVYTLIGKLPDAEAAANEMALRCTLAMVNEAVRCYEDGILRSARDGDVGAVFGIGFPPHLGGPFRFVDQRGAEEIVFRMAGLQQRHGDRFAPAPLLESMARDGTRFHAENAPPPGGR